MFTVSEGLVGISSEFVDVVLRNVEQQVANVSFSQTSPCTCCEDRVIYQTRPIVAQVT